MSGRTSVIWVAAFVMTIGVRSWGASVSVSVAAPTGNESDLKITQTAPGTNVNWNGLRSSEMTSGMQSAKPMVVYVPVKEQPTPVAPMPNAFASGGSVLLGAWLVRLMRKLKRSVA